MVAHSLSTGNPIRARPRPAMLFDVEGTLVDCVSATVRCWQETLREFGFEFTLDELHAHFRTVTTCSANCFRPRRQRGFLTLC
jgi:beta-phosphoglucomutase-like phosphatase (HAD superfamily)